MGLKSLRPPTSSKIHRKSRIGPLLSLALVVFLAYNLLLSILGSSSSSRKEAQLQNQPAHLGQHLSERKSRLARWNSHGLISLDSWSWARQAALVYIVRELYMVEQAPKTLAADCIHHLSWKVTTGLIDIRLSPVRKARYQLGRLGFKSQICITKHRNLHAMA